MTSLRFSFRVLVAGGVYAAGCSSDDSEDTGADEHGAHDHDHGAEAGSSSGTPGTTGDDHGAEEHGSSAGDEHGIDTDTSDPIVAYCGCMLEFCHDEYHAKWGEDHLESEEACAMEAQGLPSNGGPTEMGNFLECRQHFCELAMGGDESVCPNAIGEAVCVE
ncbi:MAG: hypothetical protein IAG13_12025 [Deltaproteobacteria bacterium]|nr:hypothetical protein [Nannocystaceae bacterium]